jgi:hypothetical protein
VRAQVSRWGRGFRNANRIEVCGRLIKLRTSGSESPNPESTYRASFSGGGSWSAISQSS